MSPATRRGIGLRHIEVVVPARNEEQHITACLLSIRAAARRLQRDRPGVSCGVTVVLDRCTDGTSDLVRALGERTIVTDGGCVGAARHLGVIDAIGRAGTRPNRIWLANTDADTTVPDAWLTTQVELGDNGFDVVLGTVTPGGLDADLEAHWRREHRLVEGHDHVHGANLGLRGSTYVAAGGFAAMSVHEDRDLVQRMKATTDSWIATHRTSVRTSGRLRSRVDGGFATYIAGLGAGLGSKDSACA